LNLEGSGTVKNNSQILIYQTPTGNIKIDVHLENETVWLTQAHMAELFGKGRTTITEHINNIFNEGELDEKLVCRDFRHTSSMTTDKDSLQVQKEGIV